ncbi:MAG TPA: DUF1553 domain-containing protein [Pirellulales bacterium]|nr:DUF1553 domain-containing protein [Pirellulales bacterium]
MTLCTRVCLIVLVVSCRAIGAEAPASAEGQQFFESRVRPLLSTHCFKCHGPDKQKGSLRLDSLEAILEGGDSGPALVPGNVEESPIVWAVRYSDDFVHMPPSKKLADDQVATVVRWIEMGAPWPGADQTAAKRPAKAVFEITDEDRAWWAFQPVRRPKPPKIPRDAHAITAIDAFIAARLEEKKIEPNGPATKRELIRRTSFDLIGLPPTPEEVEAFERDNSPRAFAALVDRLLERHEYGQRWGRHWLDVVRFAQTNGYERDDEKPYSWRYRDYVIRAFNEDKPYDRFILEQLAGDEIEPRTEDALIATGFYHLGVWDDEPDDKRAAEFENLDDVVVTVGAAFMGVTVGCARCHDHMFDPIPQADYYRLLSFFHNVRQYDKPTFTDASPTFVPTLAEAETAVQFFAENNVRVEQLRKESEEAEDPEQKKALRKKLIAAKNESPDVDWILCVRERGAKAPKTQVLIRGNAATAGDEVEPAFLSVLGGEKPELPAPSKESQTLGRRTALGQWLIDPRNPLPARVMANRVWQHHFGHGIVKTSTDFGRAGIEPTHPELLDWLAAEFVESGWSVKHLHRVIMNSAAYRRSSTTNNESGAAADAANDWYWRQNLRRVEAEAIRDTVLAVSGQLNTELDGRGFFPRLGAEVLAGASKPGANWEISPQGELNRRSVYMFVKRTMVPPALDLFDYNNTVQPIGERATTTVAPQSLLLLNDRLMLEQAAALAQRLIDEAGDEPARQIDRAYRLAFSREPTEQEAAVAMAYLDRQKRVFADMPARLTFRPQMPESLDKGFFDQLSPQDMLDGPTNGWAYLRGHWPVKNGVRVVDALRGPTALWQGPKFHNGMVEAELTLHDAAELASIVLRASPADDVFHGYDVTLDPQAGTVSLRRHGDELTLLGEAETVVPTGKPLKLKIAATGAHWQVWLGTQKDHAGEPILDLVDPEPRNEAGHLGVRTWGAPVSVQRLTMATGDRRIDIFSTPIEPSADDNSKRLADWEYFRGFWTRRADGAYAVEASPGAKAIWNTPTLADGTVSVQVMLQSQRGDAGLVVRVGDATDGVDALEGYNINLRPSGLRLGKHANNWRQLVNVPMPLALNVWHDVRVRLDEGRIRVWLDGSSEPLIDYVDENPFVSGRVGLRTFNADCAFRNLEVTTAEHSCRAEFGRVPAESASVDFASEQKTPERRALEAFCLLLFNLNEMIYVD